MYDSITVVTLTRKRTKLLKRAMASVQQQDYSGLIVHMVIVDDCTGAKAFLEKVRDLPDTFIWHWMPRSPKEQSGLRRIAMLRNHAVQMAQTRWISFLDDDNEFEPTHLSSLVACAMRTGYQAVHSQRKLYWSDGTPYLESRLPWCRDRDKGKQLYTSLCAEGIMQSGSNVMRDKAIPWNDPKPVTNVVDTGDWLLERTLLLQYPFCIEYTDEDWANLVGEDDKLLQCLVKNKIPIACTELATLKYYLGGISNAFA